MPQVETIAGHKLLSLDAGLDVFSGTSPASGCARPIHRAVGYNITAAPHVRISKGVCRY